MTEMLEEIKSSDASDVTGEDAFRVYTLNDGNGNGITTYLGVEISSCADSIISSTVYLSDNLEGLYARIPEGLTDGETNVQGQY